MHNEKCSSLKENKESLKPWYIMHFVARKKVGITMEQKPKYKRYGIRFFDHVVKVMQFYSLWPDDENNISKRYYFKSIIISLVMTIFPATGMIWYLILADTIGQKLKGIVWILFYSCWYSVFLAYLYKMTTIIQTPQKFFKNFPRYPGFKASFETQKKISLISQILFVVSVIAASLFIITEEKRCLIRNMYSKEQEVCGFLLPAWFPFDYESFPLKQLLLISQSIAVLLVMSTLANFAFYIICAMWYVSDAYDYLMDMLKVLSGNNKPNTNKQLLLAFIEHHKTLLTFIADVQDISNACTLLIVSMASVTIGLLAFLFLLDHSLYYAIIFVVWTVNLSIFIQSAQVLIDKSLELHSAIYNTPWYDLDKESKYIIFFLLMKTQNPEVLTVAQFGVLCSSTLLTIIRVAYTYIMALINMSDMQTLI